MKIGVRKKIIIAFVTLVLLGGALWITSDYRNYVLNKKLHIIISKIDLLNTILEARRFEKNYFLNQDEKNIDLALDYIRQAEMKLKEIIQEYGLYLSSGNLNEKVEELRKYKAAILTLSKLRGDGDGKATELSAYQEETGNLGREITKDIETMVAREKLNIDEIVARSRLYLLIGTASVFLLCFLVALFLVYNVDRPLKSIARAIKKIASGDFKNVPALGTGDEFDYLVISLNTMINELNKRSEQLIQTEKLASLGTLTSGVAHELNNPLNNIYTSLQILIEELEEGDLAYQRELLTESEKQVERARDIVKSLLEFSRETSFVLKPVHFNTLVSATLKLVKGELPANIELKLDIQDDIHVTIDSRRIQQVLINLMLNSIHAMENGGMLTISAALAPDREMMWFQVRDTGKGISEENLSKIFDPFFTTKQVGMGSGLGLSVSHGIVEKHAGRIEVESKVGEGTTFTVFLPVG